jgi:hypothetical protein
MVYTRSAQCENMGMQEKGEEEKESGDGDLGSRS